VWKFAYACPLNPKYYSGGPSATPTVANGRVYTFSKSGNVYCFNAADGAVIWKKDVIADAGVKAPDWGFASSARIEGDAVFLNAGLSGLALNKNNGDVIWKSGPGPGAYASVVPITVGAESSSRFLGRIRCLAF